jgi:hypothetical protein
MKKTTNSQSSHSSDNLDAALLRAARATARDCLKLLRKHGGILTVGRRRITNPAIDVYRLANLLVEDLRK